MSELRFGYCDIIITPPETMGLAGYEYRFEHGFGNNGVMDDLYARALSLKSGGEHLILITVDLCLIDEKTGDRIRERVSQKTGVPVENIMLCLSHTHSGPVTINRESYDAEIQHRIRAYIENLTAKIVSISSQAASIHLKGRLYASTYTAYMGYNRRLTLGDGTVKMLFDLWQSPGYTPNGTVDPHIPILMIERVDDGQTDPYLCQPGINRIVVFNVPAHPVVMGQQNRYVSADYPGAAIRCIENTLGDGTKAMFLLGPCGNVNILLACQNNPRSVDIVGNAIGYGICAALSMRKEIEFDGLKAVSGNIELEEGAAAGRVVTQVFKIGKAAIAAVSCECFTELGIRIKNESPFEQTLVASNSNGGYGYIPTREALQMGQSYEVNSAKRMGFDEDLLDKMVSKVRAQIRDISQQG